ncbi:MAG: hypothetical protein ABS63_10905 [Microbacterium sp. SCN 70-27]|uniref:hypothetical protein n=1 Tax=unclassified Microbacterium TaxID=2609290 RepID=UPI00086E417B|nr:MULTISPECIES: hypothetical protein [unclassified Microbacterium]MBN9224060.1 hypothetical protein [Microbacterium sp.]ODT26704.1 MAG: hypothetical protein ABS63_10905 [Microbacterium sp. SCN 70-27]
MRFLLIAPLRGSTAQIRSTKETTRTGDRFGADRLVQHWVDLDTVAQQIPETVNSTDAATFVGGGELAGEIRRAALCLARGLPVLALEAEVDAPAPRTKVDVGRLETRLDTLVDRFVGQNPLLGEARWAGRIALLEAGSTLGEDWSGRNRVPVTASLGDDDVELCIGWGNSEVRGWESLPDEAWRETVRGLVDAQVLWCEITQIGDAAAGSTDTMLVGDTRGVHLSRYQATLADLMTENALHNIAHDEILTNMQGERRLAAQAALGAWGYADVAARVARRLQDLDDVARRRESARSGRYQRLVERVLFILALVTVIDLAFAIVGTSYSGGVSQIPGDGSWLHLFDALREINADVFVVASIIVIAILSGILIIRRRR